MYKKARQSKIIIRVYVKPEEAALQRAVRSEDSQVKSGVESASTSSSCAALMASLLGNGSRASGTQSGQVKCKLKRRRRRRSKRKGTTLPSFRTCHPSSVSLTSEQRSCAPWRRFNPLKSRANARQLPSCTPSIFRNKITLKATKGIKWLSFQKGNRFDWTILPSVWESLLAAAFCFYQILSALSCFVYKRRLINK